MESLLTIELSVYVDSSSSLCKGSAVPFNSLPNLYYSAEAGMIQVKYVIFRGSDFALLRLVMISGQHIAI